VTTDNGSEFRAKDFGHAVEALGARQRFIRAGRPNSNGCVERAQARSSKNAGARRSPDRCSPR
jgi:transposase InsO family protein